MKNETARREIESLDYYLQNHTNDYSEESHTAMMMAIDALSNPHESQWIPKFIEQIKIKDMDRQYDAGIVCEKDGNYIIGYEMRGAEETFSIGQPVYDKDKNIMGWLGIGLFENLNYSAKIRVPCEYWQICLPTKFCEVGKQVYTYWQVTEVKPQGRSEE